MESRRSLRDPGTTLGRGRKSVFSNIRRRSDGSGIYQGSPSASGTAGFSHIQPPTTLPTGPPTSADLFPGERELVLYKAPSKKRYGISL